MKHFNGYQRALRDFKDTPKAVYAAIAYSFAALLHGEDPTPAQVEEVIRREWAALHASGVVPQAPRQGKPWNPQCPWCKDGRRPEGQFVCDDCDAKEKAHPPTAPVATCVWPATPCGDCTACSSQPRCRSDSDGNCCWAGCPQLRDGEPGKSGRSCPLWDADETL